MSLTSPAPEPAQDGMPTTRGMNFYLEDRTFNSLRDGDEAELEAKPAADLLYHLMAAGLLLAPMLFFSLHPR